MSEFAKAVILTVTVTLVCCAVMVRLSGSSAVPCRSIVVTRFVETLFDDADGIFSGDQVGRGEFAGVIRGEDKRLSEGAAGDFDARANDDRAGGVFDGAGNGVGAELRREERQRSTAIATQRK